VNRQPQTGLERFVDRVLGDRTGDDATRHRIRAYVLEQATVLELDIDEVLAASIASGLQAAHVLRSEVLWRLPIPVRLEMLADLLEREGLRDRWPYVIPVLRSFFELRHHLAHGLAHPIEVTGRGVEITMVKRGRVAMTTYPSERLEWLAWQAHVTSLELVQIWAAVVPATRAWHELS
jgi:hypothetical protein